MKCVICKTGELTPGTTTVTLQRAGATVVIKNVPARVCRNCGEEYVDEDVSASLLREAEQTLSQGVEIDVRSYAVA